MEEEILDQQTEETAEAAPTEGEPESAEAPEEAPAEAHEEAPSPPEGDAEEEGKDDLLEAIAPKRKKTAQERFDELTWKRREAERKAEEAERRAEFWRQKAEGEPPKPAPKGAPKMTDYDDQEEYLAAMVDYRLQQSSVASQQAREQERREEAVANFHRRADRLRERFEDYDEVIAAKVFTPAMMEVLWSSDNGPQLAYYLGRPENRKVADRIASLPSHLQPFEIGKLEAGLLAAARERKTTSAPPPSKPVAGTAKPVVDESRMDDDEWFKKEQQKRMDRLKTRLSGG